MKKILIAMLLLGGCQSANKLGDCIGFATSENPKLQYEISPGNAVWSMVGSPLILPVVLWPLEYAKCPVSETLSDPIGG